MFEGVDALYTLQADAVKEDIYINSPASKHNFVFRAYESLPATFTEEEQIHYQDVFSLLSPYAYDSVGNEVEVEFTYQEGYYTYTALPDEKTMYPIVLDPTISFFKYDNELVLLNSNIYTSSQDQYYTLDLEAFGFKIDKITVQALKSNYNMSTFARYQYIYKNGSASKEYDLSTTSYSVSISISEDVAALKFYASAGGGAAAFTKIILLGLETSDPNVSYGKLGAVSLGSSSNKEYSVKVTLTEPLTVPIARAYSFIYKELVAAKETEFILDGNNNITLTFPRTANMPTYTYTYFNTFFIHQMGPIYHEDHALLSLTENIIDVVSDSETITVTETITAKESQDLGLKELVQAQTHDLLTITEKAVLSNLKTLDIAETIKINDFAELPVRVSLQDLTARIPVHENKYSTNLIENMHYHDNNTPDNAKKFKSYIRTTGFKLRKLKSFPNGTTVRLRVTDMNGLYILDEYIQDITEKEFIFNDTVYDYIITASPSLPESTSKYIAMDYVIADNVTDSFTPLKLYNINPSASTYEDFIPEEDMLIDVVAGAILNLGSNRVSVRKGETYKVYRTGSTDNYNTVGIFRYNTHALFKLLALTETVLETKPGDAFIPLTETIAVKDNDDLTLNQIVQAHDYNLFNLTEMIRAQNLHHLAVTEQIQTKEKKDLATLEKVMMDDSRELIILETINSHNLNDLTLTEQITIQQIKDLTMLQNVFAEASDNLNVLETIYGKDNALITLTETIKAKESEVLNCYVTVAEQNNIALLVTQNIYDKASSLLNLTETVMTGSEAVLPALETIQATSGDTLETKAYIVTTNTNELSIKEYIAISDMESITFIEKILASDYVYINIKENLKDIDENSILINEWVKPISLELIEMVLSDKNKPIRLISFSRPVKQFRKG